MTSEQLMKRKWGADEGEGEERSQAMGREASPENKEKRVERGCSRPFKGLAAAAPKERRLGFSWDLGFLIIFFRSHFGILF